MSENPPPCLQCPEADRRPAKTRGLCPRCYLRTHRKVRRGETTWPDVEKAGAAAPDGFRFPVMVPEGTWTDAKRFEHAEHGHCLSEVGAGERTGIPRSTLRRLAREGKLTCHRVTPAVVLADPLVRVFPVAALEGLKEGYGAGSRREPHPWRHNGEPVELLTAGPLARKLGMSRRTAKTFVRYWTRKRSRLHGGMALRWEWVDQRPGVGGPSRVRGYRLDDAESILAGKEHDPREGSGRPAAPYAAGMTDARAGDVLEGLLAEGPLPGADVRRRARKQGVSPARLYRAKRARRVTHHPVTQYDPRGHRVVSYWCLPGQGPPAGAPSPVLGRAVSWLEQVLGGGDVSLKEILPRAEQAEIYDGLLYRARQELGVESYFAADGTCYWRRPGAGQPEGAPRPPGVVPEGGGPARRGRGRQRQTDPEADRRVAEAWATGHYPDKDALARELGTTRKEVVDALERHRYRQKPARR